MSLQELVGSIVHLKLSIREGHGFGFLKNSVVVVAGINGIFLETEVVPPSPDPLFHIDLVWETDKKNLRRFRASNTPLKVECFTISSSNQRDAIGSILLNIKSAQVVPGGAQKNTNEKWHRLIGVPTEAKALQPELLLSLTIQEPNALSQPLSANAMEVGKPSTPMPSVQNPVTADVIKTPRQPKLKNQLPEYKHGYIQLGAENSILDTFLLSLSVKRAVEIGLILHCSQELSNPDFTRALQISFTLMGQTKSTELFAHTKGNQSYSVNEDVLFPLKTSLSALHAFFQENPCATVRLFFSGVEVAASELHIRSLVPTNDLQIFSRQFNGETSLTQNCILVSARSGSIPLEGDLQPSIEVTSRLQLIASLSTSQKSLSALEHSKCSTHVAPIQSINQASEDLSSRSESRQSQDTFIVATQSGPVWVPVAPSLMQSVPPKQNKTTSEGDSCAWAQVIEGAPSCELKGPSDKSPVRGYIHATASFENSSDEKHAEKASSDMMSVPLHHAASIPSLPVSFKNSPDGIQSESFVEKASENMTHLPQKQTLDAESHNTVEHAMQPSLQPSVAPNNLLKPLVSNGALSSCIPAVASPTVPLDSNIAYRIVEELEDWKERQQEIFLAELKRKEVEQISKITEEWTAQAKTQNADLENKVAECKILAESLSSAKQDLRDRLKVCAAREQELCKAKEELNQQYNLKFQELTLAARRLDEEAKLKISLLESKCSKLEERLKELESENDALRNQVRQKTSVSSPPNDSQTCGLTHIQVTQLLDQVDQLEGKLQASLQSKTFFKEQWGRAVREMNQAKLQFAQTSENSTNLETLLNKEERALQNDQKTLEKIRQEIAFLNS